VSSLIEAGEPRKIRVSRPEPNGHTVPYHLEFTGDAGACAELASAAGWLRVKFFGGERFQDLKRTMRTLDLHTVCEKRALPQHGRVLGTWHCYFS